MENPAANDRWQASTSSLGERSDYKKVWDRQTADIETASLAVAGSFDEASLEGSAKYSIEMLKYTVGLHRNDVVLEIGCGIGRVGRPLSQECLHWFGADISGGMLRHAAGRLQGRPNTTLVELSTVGLQEFPGNSFDLVYCTIVFMHLYEWDRFRYIEEAFRVLCAGGRCYFDNFHFGSAPGWELFLEGAKHPPEHRPAHISMASSREELDAFLRRAGFQEIRIYELPNGLIAATGRKPD